MARKKYIIWLIVGAILAGIIFLPGYSRLQQIRSKEKELLDKITRLEEKNKRLAEEKEKLEKDLFYIEKAAREEMGVVKKGEILYKVVPRESGKGIGE